MLKYILRRSQMRIYSMEETLARVNPNKFEELSRETQIPEFNSDDINWNRIAFELFRVKRINPYKLSLSEKEITVNDFNCEEKYGGFEYARDELKVLKKCMKTLNIDISKYKNGARYSFNSIQAHFIFYMLTRDRSKRSYISKIKNNRISEINATEVAAFLRGFSIYLKFAGVDYQFKNIEKIFCKSQ